MTSQWARRGMRQGNIKYSSGGAILNILKTIIIMRVGNTKYSKRGMVWRSRGEASSGKKVIKLLCPNRLSVNINFDRICLSIISLSTFSKGQDSLLRKTAHKPAVSLHNNTHSLELHWYEKIRACIVRLEKFGAQFCTGSNSSEFGIVWVSKSSEFGIVWARNSA